MGWQLECCEEWMAAEWDRAGGGSIKKCSKHDAESKHTTATIHHHHHYFAAPLLLRLHHRFPYLCLLLILQQ